MIKLVRVVWDHGALKICILDTDSRLICRDAFEIYLGGWNAKGGGARLRILRRRLGDSSNDHRLPAFDVTPDSWLHCVRSATGRLVEFEFQYHGCLPLHTPTYNKGEKDPENL